MPATPFTARFLVRFSHADPAGIVYYPNYFDMFNAAMEDWFNQALAIDYAGLIARRRLGLPTVHAECDFRHPCHMGEHLDIIVVLRTIGRTSFGLSFIGAVAEEERLRANNVLVMLDLNSGRAVALPEDIRTAFSDYRALCAAAGLV